MADIQDPEQIASYYKHSFSRNPLYADLPLNTVITEEMRLERLQNPLRFPYRKFSCLICGEHAEYCGSRPILEDGFMMTIETNRRIFLFYCKTCNANIEVIQLEKQ